MKLETTPLARTEAYAAVTRVALIGIVVENSRAVPKMNEILHEYAHYVIGRMGIPYEKRGVSIISVAVDAPADVISALSGKIGRLEGISTKTIYSKLPDSDATAKQKLSETKT